MVGRTRGRSSGGVEVNKRGEERTRRRGGERDERARRPRRQRLRLSRPRPSRHARRARPLSLFISFRQSAKRARWLLRSAAAAATEATEALGAGLGLLGARDT